MAGEIYPKKPGSTPGIFQLAGFNMAVTKTPWRQQKTSVVERLGLVMNHIEPPSTTRSGSH